MKLGIITLSLLMAFAWCAQADSYGESNVIEGVVKRLTPDTLEIKLNGKLYPLQSAKRQTIDDLRHLETGDYVMGTGKVQDKVVLLEDLNMVGVKKVLGAWRESESRKRFEFRDFSSLKVTEVKVRSDQQLKYRLIPDKKDEWTTFLSGQNAVKAGSMVYKPESLQIDIYDLENKQVVETLSLKPDRTKKVKSITP